MFPVLPWRLRKLPVNTGKRAMFSAVMRSDFSSLICARTCSMTYKIGFLLTFVGHSYIMVNDQN